MHLCTVLVMDNYEATYAIEKIEQHVRDIAESQQKIAEQAYIANLIAHSALLGPSAKLTALIATIEKGLGIQ